MKGSKNDLSLSSVAIYNTSPGLIRPFVAFSIVPAGGFILSPANQITKIEGRGARLSRSHEKSVASAADAKSAMTIIVIFRKENATTSLGAST